MTPNEKLKNFLQLILYECELIIKKRKRKNRIIKALYISSNGISITGSSIAAILASVVAPTLVLQHYHLH